MSSFTRNTASDWKTAESLTSYKARSSTNTKLIQAAVEKQLLKNEENVIDIFDLDAWHARIEDLLAAFPEDYITHALAIKSQPLSGVLSYGLQNFPQLGIEAASWGEAYHGHKLGYPSNQIVYDSPVKSYEEMLGAIKLGMHINCDNHYEMEVIDKILKQLADEKTPSKATFGLRINPMTGAGAIASSSTAHIGAKFGLIWMDETKPEIASYFEKYRWLTGLHCHVGSQGMPLALVTQGSATICSAAEDINAILGRDQVKILDLGGGVPTSYWTDEEVYSFMDYRKELEAASPSMFSGKFKIYTEFGRSLFAKYAITLTRIGNIKRSDANGSDIDKLRAEHEQNQILFSFVGSNNFFREAYQADKWRRRFTAFNEDGSEKVVEEGHGLVKTDIAGPLCFQGDYLAKDVPLPVNIDLEDILVMHDTGGYTMSLYCKFNSRPCHSVYGMKRNGDGFDFYEFKKRETLDQVLEFWGPRGELKKVE